MAFKASSCHAVGGFLTFAGLLHNPNTGLASDLGWAREAGDAGDFRLRDRLPRSNIKRGQGQTSIPLFSAWEEPAKAAKAGCRWDWSHTYTVCVHAFTEHGKKLATSARC